MMLQTSLAAVTALLGQQVSAQGFNELRFGCGQLVIDRIDPLVNPNMIPSPHTHQVVGGNAFNVSV